MTADLLAGRRRGLHASFAQSLVASVGSGAAAEIAGHWAAAGRAEEELAWRAIAGGAAEAMYAFAEAAQHWERVTHLWDMATAKPTGLRLGQAYIYAIGDWYNCSDAARAGTLTEAGLAQVPEDDVYERAVLLEWASVYRRVSSLDSALQASHESVRLFSTLPPSHWHVSALGTYGRLLDVVGRPDDAASVLAQGLVVAKASGSPDLEAGALIDLGEHELFAGDWQRGRAYLAQASDLTRESQDVEALLFVATAETDVLLRMGQLHQAVLVAQQALDRTRSLGGGSFPEALIVRANVAEALLELGRVADAGLLIEPVTSGKPTLHDRGVHQLRAELDIVRGLLEEAADRLDAVRAVVPHNPSVLLEIERAALEVALWRRTPEDVVRAMTFLQRITDTPDSRDAGRLLTLAMRAYGDLADRARARGDKPALRHAVEGGEQLVAQHGLMRCDPFAVHPAVATARADHALWQAEYARLSDADQTQHWEVAAEAWHSLERPHRRAYALWRQAEAMLATDNSPAAAAVLRLAASQATDLAPLLERIGTLARRARIDLGPLQPPTEPSANLGYSLTERELDVLRLLARGHTNAQIGAVLFMSPKTASVHVTHILRKLGVTGRVQAATIAERAGLLDDGESDRS